MTDTKKPIFIHIPKTGGTSINCVMKDTAWQTPLDFHYRHLAFEDKMSTAGDIFEPTNIEKYQDEFIFMMLRDPIDRLISEYYYIRKNNDFMNFLDKKPDSFEQYCQNPQTANYMLKFLDGKRIYDTSEMTEQRTDEIINQIDALDIHTGIFEQYDRSLSYLSEVGDFQWPETIDIKRATINRPKAENIPQHIKQQIISSNRLDYKLYHHCLKKLLSRTEHLQFHARKYKGGRLDFVIPYTMFNCILDIELKNQRYIQENKKFFVTLNTYLHKTAASGKDYAKNWVKLFKKSVAIYHKGSKFAKSIKQIKKRCPIDEIIAIAQAIDYAAVRPSLGLEFGTPKIKLQLTNEMAAVMTKEDAMTKGVIKW